MKSFITKNSEKVLLISLLFTLAICAVYQILSMGADEIKTLPDANSGSMISKTKIPSIEGTKVSLIEGTDQPYNPQGYIYCRKSDCKGIILNTKQKCPYCDTPTTAPISPSLKTGDTDKDGIPDEIEIKFQLDINDPSDALADKDGDGFRNVDEFKKKTSLDDAKDHPTVIHRTRLVKRRHIQYPFSVSSIDTGKYDPKNKGELHKESWDIQADIIVKKRKRSAFYKINDYEKATGYTVTDVGIEGEKPFVIFQKDEEIPVKVFANNRRQIRITYYNLYNEITKKTVKCYIGKKFYLEDKNGKKEQYRLMSFSPEKKAVMVRNITESKKPMVGLKTALEAPVETENLEDPENPLQDLNF